MVTIDEYLKEILGQILASYKTLTELNDNPNDLEIIKKELSKISGLLQVMRSKLDGKKYQTDHLVTLYKLAVYYIDTYDFTREIEILGQVYYKDSDRLKNLRLLIIDSLNDNPNDLEIIKKELSKINGLLQVMRSKLDGKKYQTDRLVALYKLATYYIDTYDFTREIEILGQIYYKDSDRLKNLRLLIINSLNDKKLIEKLQTILNEL